MKIETAKLTSHNGMSQNVSTRLINGQPEITSRSGRYKAVTASTIAGAQGKRRSMQITAMMASLFN